MGGLKLQDVARRCATEVLVDLRDHRSGAYLVQVAARRQALDRLVIESAIDVDGDLVAVVSWTLHRFQRGVLTAEGLYLLLNVLVGGLGGRNLDPQRAVPSDGGPGTDRHHSVKGQRSRLLTACDLNLWRVDGVDVVLHKSPAVVVGQGVVQGLLSPGRLTEPGFQDLSGRLAGPKAGQPDLPGDLTKGGIHGHVELVLGDGDSQPHPVAVQMLQGGLHGGRSVPAVL